MNNDQRGGGAGNPGTPSCLPPPHLLDNPKAHYKNVHFPDSGLAVHLTFDNIQGQQVIGNSAKGIDGKLVGQSAQNSYSRKCQKGIEFVKGQGHIELGGNKLDAENKDAMTISVWIRLVNNDRVNTIYGSVGAMGTHHLSVKSTGSPNAVIHWLHKAPDGKVVFDITTEPAVPAGQCSFKSENE